MVPSFSWLSCFGSIGVTGLLSVRARDRLPTHSLGVVPMETRSNAQRFFGRWALATFGGWVLGFVVIVLLAGIGDLVHIGGDQWAVGVGMGWSIGCAQWWVARKWFGPSSKWM